MAELYDSQLHGDVDIMDGIIKIHGSSVRWEIDATNADKNLRLVSFDPVTNEKVTEIILDHTSGEVGTSNLNTKVGEVEVELTDASSVQMFNLVDLNALFGVSGYTSPHFTAMFTNPDISQYEATSIGAYWEDDILCAYLGKNITGTIKINYMIFFVA